MKEINNYIETLRREAAELDGLNSKVTGNKALTVLMETIRDAVEELLETQSKKEYYDPDLGKNIAKSVDAVISAFLKTKPPTVSNQINVDLNPLKLIAAEIAKGQNTIAGLVEKMNKSDKSDELYRMVVSTNSQIKLFLEKSIQHIDYSDQLSKLIESQKRPVLEKLTLTRDQYGRITAIPEYKK